eukprot:jgi/Mesvir1/6767/Mv03080-RA.1
MVQRYITQDTTWMHNPETGEKIYRTQKNKADAENWKKNNPGKEPHVPTQRCLRCKQLKPTDSFLTESGKWDECNPCRDNMEKFARRRDDSIRATAKKEVARIAGGAVSEDLPILPKCGRGDKEFEDAIRQVRDYSVGGGGDEGLDGLGSCLLCEERLESVHVPTTKQRHFHAGGACGGCVVQFLIKQEDDSDADCPICIVEKRPLDLVAKLQFPYFTFDFTLTALAHVLNGDWYGGADFFMLQEEEKEPEELPPVCPARARALGAGVDAESALKCEETFLSGTQPGDKWEVEVIEETPPSPKRVRPFRRCAPTLPFGK